MITHRLPAADLLAVAEGPVSADLVERLRAAEFSRHQLLLEAVRRRAMRRGRHIEVTRLEQVLADLRRLQRRSPDLVRELLGRPQVGAWAFRCLGALESGRRVDVSYLTALVERSAERAGTRLRVTESGVALDVLFDHADPYLDLYGPRAGEADPAQTAAWRERLAGGWRLIVRYDRALAEAMAAGLTTLVPLRPGAGRRPRSATSGWAFGAVAMSLPPDDLSCADTLIHEFRHVLLDALTDLFVLMRPVTGVLVYSPWREDPRPLPALLFGCHAYAGLLDFWRRQTGGEAAAKHARWLEPTSAAADVLASSQVLTTEGTLLVAALRRKLARWRRARPPAARRTAEYAAADHYLRWRMRHLRPDGRALDDLADAWLAGARPTPVRVRVDTVPLRGLSPGSRSWLLESAFGGGAIEFRTPGPADRALLDGRYDAAVREYKTRVATGRDPDAWVGLGLGRLRSRPRSALCLRPEVVAALHDRLRARTGRPYDPDQLGDWLGSG